MVDVVDQLSGISSPSTVFHRSTTERRTSRMTDETTHPRPTEEPSHVHVPRPSRRRRNVAGTWPEYSWAPLSLDDPEPDDEAAA
jgi:hypothetical protein